MARADDRAKHRAGLRPAPRLGPRPLALHLSLAVLAWQSSKAALPLLRHDSLPWKGELAKTAAALRSDLDGLADEALNDAVSAEADRRFAALLEGLQAYRAHPYGRDLEDPPEVWREGSSRLLDYGARKGRKAGGTAGTPLLVVPSLINRAYILDLSEETSLLRWLAKRGFRPFLMDWDRPGPDERSFTLTDYVAGRLERALDRVLELCGQPPRLLGYCMGGLLALALAARRGRDVSGLALLATPWDFHAEQAAQARLAGASLSALGPVVDALGELPVDAIQAFFAGLDPLLVVRKFVAFAGLERDDPKALQFVALEDWLNDGVPLAGPVARECLAGWYGQNTTGRGQWRIAGQPVLPERISPPSLCVLPYHDRIVPPASAEALARALPDCTPCRPSVGHVGMMASGVAKTRVWRPLAAWLAQPGAQPG